MAICITHIPKVPHLLRATRTVWTGLLSQGQVVKSVYKCYIWCVHFQKHTEATKLKISLKKRIYPTLSATCRACKKTFEFRPWKWVPRRVYCSGVCRYKHGARTGIALSVESRKKLSMKYMGAGNPIWRGGVSFERCRGDVAQKHKVWRQAIFERDNYTCKKCGESGGRLNADHIKPYALCNETEKWDMANGQTLCHRCHRKKTNWELKQYWRNQYGVSNNFPKPSKG